jgi:hypothetical protein
MLNTLRVPWVVVSDGDVVESLARQLVAAGLTTKAAFNAAAAAGRLREDILLPHDCIALDTDKDFEGALIYGGAYAEYEAAIDENIGKGELAKFVEADPGRKAMPREERVWQFMKSRRWGRKWKVLFAGIVAERITAGGTDSSRIPPLIAAALNRARDFASGAAIKVWP